LIINGGDKMKKNCLFLFFCLILLVFSIGLVSASDKVLYVLGEEAYVYAVDASTGKEIWAYETGGKGFKEPIVVEDRVLYILGEEAWIYAVDASTGKEIWAYETGGKGFKELVVEDGVLYVVGEEAYVYAVDASTGKEIWAYETGGKGFKGLVVDVKQPSKLRRFARAPGAEGGSLWLVWVLVGLAIVAGGVYWYTKKKPAKQRKKRK
jgi:hypothetical protein